nr:hypothetical protein BaRGS_024782 [Batillaria attramentaria]
MKFDFLSPFIDDTALVTAGVDTVTDVGDAIKAGVNIAVVTDSWADDSIDNGVEDKMVVEVKDKVFRVVGEVESDFEITGVDSSGATQAS